MILIFLDFGTPSAENILAISLALCLLVLAFQVYISLEHRRYLMTRMQNCIVLLFGGILLLSLNFIHVHSQCSCKFKLYLLPSWLIRCTSHWNLYHNRSVILKFLFLFLFSSHFPSRGCCDDIDYWSLFS
jgi:hypothetical protein